MGTDRYICYASQQLRYGYRYIMVCPGLSPNSVRSLAPSLTHFPSRPRVPSSAVETAQLLRQQEDIVDDCIGERQDVVCILGRNDGVCSVRGIVPLVSEFFAPLIKACINQPFVFELLQPCAKVRISCTVVAADGLNCTATHCRRRQERAYLHTLFGFINRLANNGRNICSEGLARFGIGADELTPYSLFVAVVFF